MLFWTASGKSLALKERCLSRLTHSPERCSNISTVVGLRSTCELRRPRWARSVRRFESDQGAGVVSTLRIALLPSGRVQQIIAKVMNYHPDPAGEPTSYST